MHAFPSAPVGAAWAPTPMPAQQLHHDAAATPSSTAASKLVRISISKG